MVDLVKIRKKAKRLTADSGQLTGEAAANAAPASSESQASDSQSPQSAPAETPVSGQLSAVSSQTPSPSPQPPAPSPPPDKLARFKETAGRLRSDAAAETAAQEQVAAAGELELLTFVIANENYAVDIERIVEIVRPRPVTRVPNADPSILGISSLRGTIVTLVDVRSRLRHAQLAETPDTRVIVLDHHGETLGFEVDRVLRVVKVAPGALEPHPVVHSSEADESIRGVFRHAGALTILLDFDKLLGPGH